MKIDTRIWRDVSAERTDSLVRKLAGGSVFFAGFGALMGACFALAWIGGTENMRPWQWTLCGATILCFLVVMAIGGARHSRIITDRINTKDKSSQQAVAG